MAAVPKHKRNQKGNYQNLNWEQLNYRTPETWKNVTKTLEPGTRNRRHENADETLGKTHRRKCRHYIYMKK